MTKRRIVVAAAMAAAMALGAGVSRGEGDKKPDFFRVNIKSGYLTLREGPTVKAKAAGVFYVGNDCVAGLGETKKDGERTWMKVYQPYLRTTGWVDSKFLAATESDCGFEAFLYGTRGKKDWLFESMEFPLVISSPNVDEGPPSSYTKEEVLASVKNLYEAPYYYLQLMDDAGMRKFWGERDGCAKYELMENSKYDVNSYVLYTVEKKEEGVSLTFSCNEMYPEFQFVEKDGGFVLKGIVDSGS